MRKQSSFILALLSIAAVLSSACGRSTDANSNTNTQPATVAVKTAQAVIKPIPSYIEATGNLASDEQTDVAPAIAGKVVEVNFDIGSYVKQGDVLLRLDSRDAAIRVEQAKAQAEQQRQAAAQAEANVAQAIANLRSTQDRLGIKDGQTFRVNDFPQVRAVSPQLELAEREFQRAERLLATGDVSRSLYDQRKAQRDQLRGQLEEARSNAAVAIRAINIAQTGVETAKAAAAAARAGIATAETQIAAAQKTLSDNAVYAPISGYVSERSANLGEYISPSAPNTKIATIMRTSTLRVRIDIPEQYIGKVATGQGVSLQASSHPDRNFAGTVARISPSIDPTSRALTVEAEVQNVEGLLKPGQFVTVRITQSQPEPAVMVPVSAIRTTGETNSVFVIRDGIARQQFVQTGLLENDMIQIRQGVIEGDVVAVENVAALNDGVLVAQ